MVENLVIDILRTRYPQSGEGNLDIYFIKEDHRFQDFTMLIENLEDRKNDFGPDKTTLSKWL